ncbi:MAG: hypothetical protein ACJ8AW_50440, partial [Rhodopila sp.]
AVLSLIVGRLEDFARQVRQQMAAVDWSKQRDLIRLLVKRVEIDREEVNVVLRVTPAPTDPGSSDQNDEHLLHHCGRSDRSSFGQYSPRFTSCWPARHRLMKSPPRA